MFLEVISFVESNPPAGEFSVVSNLLTKIFVVDPGI